MKMTKRLAALTGAMLLAVSLAVPASAHQHHGNHSSAVKAVCLLDETARQVACRAGSSSKCLGVIPAQAEMLRQCRAACQNNCTTTNVPCYTNCETPAANRCTNNYGNGHHGGHGHHGCR